MKRKTCIFKNVVMLFMAIGLFAVFVGCDDKNDEVGPLRQEVQALRSDLTKDFDAKVSAKTDELQKQVDNLKARLTELSNKEVGVSAEELESVKKQIIDATVAKTAFEEYKESVKAKIEEAATVAELNALKGKIESVESRVAALETLVGENKSALDEALDDLKAEFNGALDTQISSLQSKIEANKSDLVSMLNEYKRIAEQNSDANATAIETLNNKLAELERKMNIGVVKAMLNSRLTSLVLLPEYVSDKGGALPIISFSPLQTEAQCAKFLEPAVEVKYIVNPSTVTASDIDTQNLRFRYNDPKTVASRAIKDAAPKAEFVSLENGILTVKAHINLDGTWVANPDKNVDKRIDQLMLEVPVKGEDAVVSSDWAKIDYKAKSAEIVKTPKKVTGHSWSKYVLEPTAQKAKELNVNAPTVVEMAWDKTIDMKRVVKSMYSTLGENDNFDPAKYGLEFAFDLNDEKGDKIVYEIGGNKTNQQEFINLNGSIVSTRVYGRDANRAAIGRTPIVHVMLKKGDCVVKEGFVKFSIVETAIPPVPPVVFEPANKTYEAVCGASQVVHKIGTKEMNEEFYHAVDMSKEDFHSKYTFKNEDGGVGTIVEKPDPTDRTSFNLEYTLTEAEVWANAGKQVSKKATYTYNNSVIEMTFKVTIVKPTVTFDVLLDNYWYNNSALVKSGKDGVKNTIVHNVAVPQSADDSDPDHATYKNNINNAFQSKGNLLDMESLGEEYKDYTYEYRFDKGNQPISGTSVSNDGKKLMFGSEVIATIERTAEGDMIKYGTSDKAKELLNKGPQYSKAKVVLVVKNTCGKEVNVVVKGLEGKDRFTVIFLRPINVEGVSTKHFVDGVDATTTGSYIDIKEIAALSDWRNFVTETKNYDFLPNHKNYYDYYGVKNIKVNVDNITTEGLTIGGTAVSGVPETVVIDQTPNDEVVGSKTYKYGRLTYHNNGNNLGQEFWLVLPVTVEYKWGEIVNTDVRVRVAPTKEARKRVK